MCARVYMCIVAATDVLFGLKKKTMQKLPASAGDDIVLAEKERASREVGTTMYVGDRWLIRRWQCTEARFAIRWLCWWVSHLLFALSLVPGRQDLAAANQERDLRPWIIVAGHRPMYATEKSDSDGLMSSGHSNR